MIVTHEISMDLVRRGLMPCIDTMQDDKYSRNLKIKLLENGSAFDLPLQCQVLVSFSKPDGTRGTYDTMPDGTTAWKIKDNVVTVGLAPQVCTVSGKVYLTVALLYGQAELNCFTICLNVQKKPQGVMMSQSYVNVTGFIPQPKGAKKGQYLQISGVSSDGKILSVEPVDAMTAITEPSDWRQNDEAVPGYVKNRTHWIAENRKSVLEDTEVEITDGAGALGQALPLVLGDRYIVTVEGTEYVCLCHLGTYSGATTLDLGNSGLYNGAQETEEPFVIAVSTEAGESHVLLSQEDDSYTFRVCHLEKQYHTLPERYLSFLETGDAEVVDTLTWDGNTQGCPMIQILDNSAWYKVSDSLPSEEELAAGCVAVIDGETYTDVRHGEGYSVVADVGILIFRTTEISGLSVPETGIYFLKFLDEDASYVQSFTIGAYNFAPDWKIKESYLPAYLVSPTVEVSKENGVTTITITDGEGVHTATILDGADGTGESAVPTYVQEEAARLAGVVQGRQNANTVTFLACSDLHYSLAHTNTQQMTQSLIHMGQAMERIRSDVHLDFAAMLGDMIWGSGETTSQAQEAMRFVNSCLSAGFAGIPNFRTKGNYESFPSDETGLTEDQVYASVGIYNTGAVYNSDNRTAGYCYRDFPDQKLRVVCINTNEATDGVFCVSEAQNTWLASVLDLSSLAEGWASILLSHHPLDWTGSSANVVQTVAAASGVLCAIHGHVHGFGVGTITGTEIPRIAVPNACFYRNNEYGTNGTAENSEGTEFGEETTYDKTADSAEDTAFCVVTIDLVNKKVYADHYGAGYDRVISLDGTTVATYTVTNQLTNVTTSNAATEAVEGTAYAATLTAASGYAISAVTVTMGGEDVTASAYSAGQISISSVTGNIVIIAEAAEESSGEGEADSGSTYTNLVSTSVSPLGTGIYNGIGYKDATYVSGINDGGTDDACVATGLIYLPTDVETIYVKGAAWDTSNGHVRFYVVSSVGASTVDHTIKADGSGSSTLSNFFTVTELDTNYYQWTLNDNGKSALGGKYYCVSLVGTGENLVITHDEPIE